MERTWRINRTDYETKRNLILKNKAKGAETTNDWAALSLNSDLSNDERMLRLMMNNDPEIPNISYISITYMCSAMKGPSEEFIEDATYLNSGLALIGCWNDEVVNWVLDVYSKRVPKDSYTRSGNALIDILDAVNTERFTTVCPEYDQFLKELLKPYYELIDNLRARQKYINKIEDDWDFAESVVDSYQLAYSVSNYTIPVVNRLDWPALDVRNMRDSFVDQYYRMTTKEKKLTPMVAAPPVVRKKGGRKSAPKSPVNMDELEEV